MRIDLNSDLGESFGRYVLADDEAIMSQITSANIACGFHAGDPLVMGKTVRLANRYGVAVGAHVGFPDLVGFGRREIKASETEMVHDILYQLGALKAFCDVQGVSLQHVKAHGALYNMSLLDESVAKAIVEAVSLFDANLHILTMSGVLERLARMKGLSVKLEAFPDRTYTLDGRLLDRSVEGSLITEPDLVARRAVDLVLGDRHFDSLCLHGDHPQAASTAVLVRKRLVEAKVELVAMGRV